MLWLKSFHLIFMVCWFAGIFYLPRLFVNHAMTTNAAVREQLGLMERKLYRFITPFMFLTIGFGLALVSLNSNYYLQSGWFHAKTLLVILLVGYHFYCGHCITLLKHDPSARSHVFYRIFNEAPVLALFAIIFLVVLKPAF